MRGRNHDEQASGVMPILLKTKPTFVRSQTTRISIAQVIVAPMPTAAPLIAAMIGFFAVVNREHDLTTGITNAFFYLGVAESFAHIVHRRFERLVEAEDVTFTREIHTSAECAAGTGNNHGADAVILAGSVEGSDQFIGHLNRKGIHLLGAIESKS
jgi:hypothetical protein